MTQEEKARAFDEFVNKVEEMRTLDKAHQLNIRLGFNEKKDADWYIEAMSNLGGLEDIEKEVDTMIQFYKENIKHDTTASTSTQQ